MNTEQLVTRLSAGEVDAHLSMLYGDRLVSRRKRLVTAACRFSELYGGEREVSLYSVPGRSELSGNHTDHNRGRVIAASIDLDIIAVAAPRDDGIIRIKSEGHDEDTVDIRTYTAPDASGFGSSAALIAGICAGFSAAGYTVGGFDAYTTSNVLKGSGLSSSAAFEVMVGNILNHLYNGGRIDGTDIAKISQFSENSFFGKPCGLMDQMACAVGSIVSIDFADTSAPVIEKMDFDISAAGYRLCIVDTGGSHADLTDDYAAVPAEMKAVAACFGKTCLRETDEKKFIASIPELREKLGDRAVLRAIHFFDENRRVGEQTDALRVGDLRRFIDGVLQSGVSSFCYLQNAYSPKHINEQGVPLALALCERYLKNAGGAWRLHGGGFAGTVQAFVPVGECAGFSALMESVFGAGSCLELRVRRDGAVRLL